jgi:TetR/AcrR family transcriptional repressor of bet genes
VPKQVDHAERRRQIAEAVLRVIATRGMEAVSLRDVAAEADVSMGMVQHYFTSKNEMLIFACSHMLDRTRQAIATRIADLGEDPDARSIMRVILMAIVPQSEEERQASRIWVAFLARTVVDPELGTFLRDTWVDSHRFIADQIRLLQRDGLISGDRDPDCATAQALSLADGLVSHVLLGHYSAEEAQGTIDQFLAQLFSPS